MHPRDSQESSPAPQFESINSLALSLHYGPALTSIHTTGKIMCVCLVTQSCQTLCDPMDCSFPGFSVHGDSSGRNTGVGYHALLQRIFPTQESNPGLPHCRLILYHLNHQGSPSFDYIHFVSKVMSLLFNMLSRFVIPFLLRRKHLLISWL